MRLRLKEDDAPLGETAGRFVTAFQLFFLFIRVLWALLNTSAARYLLLCLSLVPRSTAVSLAMAFGFELHAKNYRDPNSTKIVYQLQYPCSLEI